MTEKRKYKKSTIIREGAEIKRANPSTHYVDNAGFYQALVARRVLVEAAELEGKPVPRVSEYIGKCLLDISKHLSTKYYFQNYPFREEMVMDAVEHMLKYVDSFDTQKGSNPFAYFTQTAYYQFLATIRLEKRKLALKFKATLDSLANAGQWIADDPDFALMIAEENLPDVGFMSEFVKNFEESEKKKRRPKDKGQTVDIVEPEPEGDAE